MYPVLFRLGTFELRSYGIIVALSFFLGLWLSARQAKRLVLGAIAGFCIFGEASWSRRKL